MNYDGGGPLWVPQSHQDYSQQADRIEVWGQDHKVSNHVANTPHMPGSVREVSIGMVSVVEEKCGRKLV